VSAADEYVGRAVATTLRLLDEHHALVHPELEARIAEASHIGSTNNIDPHHITTALRELRDSGRIEWIETTARGGQKITTIQPVDTARRATKITKAAARKRLLLARYNGWAQSSARYPQGLIGPAGEQAVRTALASSGRLQPAEPGFAETRRLLGVTLTGPLDSAGYLVPLSSAGVPGAPVTVAIEVKNIRSWIYPQSVELYQLLDKATTLQEHHPAQPILPVLVCRRAHETTFWMAQQLGFTVIAMERQFVDKVDPDDLLEIRNELHFQDLYVATEPAVRVRDRFRATLPTYATQYAAEWQTTCADAPTADLIHQLRRATKNADRPPLMNALRARAAERGKRGGW
jgi:hypothetical protein